MSRVPQSSPRFYGWIIVIACFAATFMLGEAMWAFGVFFKPLENEFGWSRTDISSAYTALLIGYAVSVIVSGRLVDRYSPRVILIVIAVLAGLGVSLNSTASSLAQLRASMLVAGLGVGGSWSVPVSVVQRWFYGKQKAALALSIAASGVGVGGMVFAPLNNYLILALGWRQAFLIAGIIFFSVLAVSAALVRKAPAVAAESPTGKHIFAGISPPVVWTTRRALVTPAYMGIVFAILAAMTAFQAISVHFVPHAIDAGISSTVAAGALGLMGGFSILGRVSAGLIADRIGWQRTLGLALLGLGVNVLWVILLNAPWMLYTFVFFYGVFHGIQSPSQVGILGRFFGMGSIGELIGISSAIGQGAGAFAPYMAGFIFDTTGSYTIAFLVVMALLLGGGIVAIKIKEPISYDKSVSHVQAGPG